MKHGLKHGRQKMRPRLALLVGAQHTLLAPPLLTVFTRGAA